MCRTRQRLRFATTVPEGALWRGVPGLRCPCRQAGKAGRLFACCSVFAGLPGCRPRFWGLGALP